MMSISERLERYKENKEDEQYASSQDEKLRDRIFFLLAHPKINKDCMVDAYYYDYSAIPQSVREMFCRDMYLIFGITEDGNIVSKWVERYEMEKDES